MGRLIEANALLSEMEKYSDDTASSKNDYLFGMQQRLETCIELVEDAPTVDAVPVVHGHWIKFGVSDKDGNQQYRCSVCECEEIHSPLVKVSYCWNCGARMDGKDGDNG